MITPAAGQKPLRYFTIHFYSIPFTNKYHIFDYTQQ